MNILMRCLAFLMLPLNPLFLTFSLLVLRGWIGLVRELLIAIMTIEGALCFLEIVLTAVSYQ